MGRQRKFRVQALNRQMYVQASVELFSQDGQHTAAEMEHAAADLAVKVRDAIANTQYAAFSPFQITLKRSR